MDEEVVNTPELRCSFCNKSRKDVKKLIAGPTAYICDECVAVCNDILEEEGIIATVGLRAAERTADRADEHLRVAQTLLAAGELIAAARETRTAAIDALRGLLATDGNPAAEGWLDTKVFTKAMAALPDVARTLHEKDVAHVILRVTLDGALLTHEDLAQGMNAARELTNMLREKAAAKTENRNPKTD